MSENTGPEIVRYWIDTDVCLDQRKCVHEAPDMIADRAQAGGPEILSATPKNKEEVMQILNAAWVCPVAAFKIELPDGTVHDSSGDVIRKMCREYG